MLIVKIELDKSKENYLAVMNALAEFDIASASWDDGVSPQVDYKVKSGQTDPSDLGAALSAATNFLRSRHGKL